MKRLSEITSIAKEIVQNIPELKHGTVMVKTADKYLKSKSDFNTAFKEIPNDKEEIKKIYELTQIEEDKKKEDKKLCKSLGNLSI